jgi:hypothetical protein
VHTEQRSGETTLTNCSVPTDTIKIVKNSSGYSSVGWEYRPKQLNLYWCHLPELSYNLICLNRPYRSYFSLEVRFTAFRMTETHHGYRHAQLQGDPDPTDTFVTTWRLAKANQSTYKCIHSVSSSSSSYFQQIRLSEECHQFLSDLLAKFHSSHHSIVQCEKSFSLWYSFRNRSTAKRNINIFLLILPVTYKRN